MIPPLVLKTCIELVKKDLQRFAVDANLCDKYGATYPAALNASKHRKKLLKVLDFLVKERENK